MRTCLNPKPYGVFVQGDGDGTTSYNPMRMAKPLTLNPIPYGVFAQSDGDGTASYNPMMMEANMPKPLTLNPMVYLPRATETAPRVTTL